MMGKKITIVRLQSKETEDGNLHLGINSQHLFLKIKVYSDHSHQFFWSVIWLVLYLDYKHLWRRQHVRKELSCKWFLQKPASPTSEAREISLVHLCVSVLFSWALNHPIPCHTENMTQLEKNVFITWFEDYSNLVLMVGYYFEISVCFTIYCL